MLEMQGLGCAVTGGETATLLSGILVLLSASLLTAVKAPNWWPAGRWKPVAETLDAGAQPG